MIQEMFPQIIPKQMFIDKIEILKWIKIQQHYVEEFQL